MRAIATQAERLELNNLRDALLNEIKLELKYVDNNLLNLNRQELNDLVNNELKSYRKHIGSGAGRPKRAITLYRELKKNQTLLDAEFI
jgi:hypothetical protein